MSSRVLNENIAVASHPHGANKISDTDTDMKGKLYEMPRRVNCLGTVGVLYAVSKRTCLF
jgi:hypothetical protein